ncbi:hypothetical protein Taro_046777 [Colocasia esculenta]|uniref:Uncharacterized protein n=1 Tax=Colocasia esculenta TaxID=4460 RepID=A0A843X7L5_COLES|nr:hypothetical protein [Colocasia esculenta]
MAPKKGNNEDIGWQHGTALGSRHNYKYNYCGHTEQGGGVSRLKKHLAGGRLAGYHDVQGCKSVPAEVKRLMIEHLKGVRADTQRKRADREMQERIISGRQRDEDDDDEPEIHAKYVPDVPEQKGSFEVGSGSGGNGSRVGGETQSRRFSNVGDYFTHIPTDIPIPDQHQGKGRDLQVLRVVDGDRRPTIELVYAKIEAAKKIREVSPCYAHLVLDVVEDRWDRQMSRDLYMAAYYLHPAYHYALELSYEDDLTAAFTRMKSFREGVGSFAKPSAIAGWDRINSEEEGEHGDVGGGKQPHSSQFRAEEEDEVDLLGDLRMERAMPSTGGANVDDDVQFERWMLGPTARSQSMREAPAIASSQPRRKGSHTQSPAPSQAAKGKAVATSQPTKGKGKDIGQIGGPAKGIVIREPTAPAQKKKSWFSWGSKKGKKMIAPVLDPLDIADLETLDPNAEETPSEDSPRLPNSRSHDSMTIGSPGGSVGGGDGDGGGDEGNDGDGGGGGGGGESGQGGGSGGGIHFTAEQHYGGHCTQDTDHGGPVQYNRRRKFVKGGRAKGSTVDSDSYNTMISDFERMNTHESIYAPAEDVQMASLKIVRPGCEVWNHFVREFRTRYYTMITWDEFRTFVSQTKSYHLIGELPSESDKFVQPQWGTYDPYQQGYWGY